MLALALLHLLARFGLQVPLHFNDRHFLPQETVNGLQERLHLVDFQHALFRALLDVAEELGEAVHLRDRIFDAADHLLEQLIRILRHDTGDLAGDIQVFLHQGNRLGAFLPGARTQSSVSFFTSTSAG